MTSFPSPSGFFGNCPRPAIRPARDRAYHPRLLEELESRVLLSAAPAVVGPAAKLIIGEQPTNGYVGLANAFTFTAEVEDANGNLVTTDTSTIKLKIDTGPGGALHGTLSAKAVGGIASFNNLLFSKVGTFTLTAADGALTTAQSAAITINAAPKVASLVFTQQPVGNPTGATITPAMTVNVLDQYGNLYTKSTSVSLKLLPDPTGAKATGKLTVKAVNGFATFSSISITKGGSNFVLQAKDAKFTVNSSSFNMGGPSAAHTLVFLQQPTDTTADSLMTPAVTVEVMDQYGAVLTTGHSTVKLLVASGLDSHKVFTAPVKLGIATFSKLQYTTAGAYTLQATDGILPPMNSQGFNITAGAAAGLAFAQIPDNGDAHATATTIKVDVVDKFGNVATSNTSTVILSFASAPAGTVPLNLSVAAVAGEASFSALTFPIAGHFMLKATDSPLASATSKSFILI